MPKSQVQRGKFVVVEGVDGVGKSTICSLLRSELERRGRPCEVVYGVPPPFTAITAAVAELNNVRCRYYFYLASNCHLSEIVAQKLVSTNVIADRYVFSTYAYHLARGLDIQAPVFGPQHLLAPDLAILLSVQREEMRRSRLASRGTLSIDDREENSQGSFVWKVQETFQSLGLVEVDNSTENPIGAVNRILELLRLDPPRYQ